MAPARGTQGTARPNWPSVERMGTSNMRLLLAQCLGAATAVGQEFHRAYTQWVDGAVCFDLPDSLAAKLDLPGIARRTLGSATFERPSAAQIEQHHFDSGNSALFPFEVPLPPAAAARPWVLLSTQGAQRLHPTRLRGDLVLRTDGRNRPPRRTADPPTVRARACTAAAGKNHSTDPQVAFNPANAAFVIESSPPWESRPLTVDGDGHTVTTSYGGMKYMLAAPPVGQPKGAAGAILLNRPNRRPLALIAWRGDRDDATCLHRFSLHELGAFGQAIDIAWNGYDCDP